MDLRRNRAHYDVTVMKIYYNSNELTSIRTHIDNKQGSYCNDGDSIMEHFHIN